MAKAWKLSPSDFAFLWEECKRCFYIKVASGFSRPRGIMPGIFNRIDGAMKAFYMGKRTETIAPGLPGGAVAFAEQWVESTPITAPNRKSAAWVKGKFDTALKFDDLSFGILDFKTSSTRVENLGLYGRQLHAYAHALENPANGGFSLAPISRLGLLVYEPRSLGAGAGPNLALTGPISWIDIPRDDKAFTEFISEVLAVLELTSPPAGSASCEWCAYRDTSRRTAL